MNPLRIESVPFSWIGANAAGQEAPVATGAHFYQISTPRVRALSITGSAAGQSTPDKVNRRIGSAGSLILGLF
jgi:hypothetical protein